MFNVIRCWGINVSLVHDAPISVKHLLSLCALGVYHDFCGFLCLEARNSLIIWLCGWRTAIWECLWSAVEKAKGKKANVCVSSIYSHSIKCLLLSPIWRRGNLAPWKLSNLIESPVRQWTVTTEVYSSANLHLQGGGASALRAGTRWETSLLVVVNSVLGIS